MDVKAAMPRIALLFAVFGMIACESPLSSDGSRIETTVSSPSSALATSPADASRLAQDFPYQKILCFGDSLTYGVTLRASSGAGGRSELTLVEGYVPKLARLLREEHGEGVELVNAGISNEDTVLGLERIDVEIRRHEPDLILLLEGIVEVNNESPRFDEVEANLAEMMRIAQLRQVAIIAGTYPLLNPGGFRTRGAAHIPRLNDIIREEALAKGIPIADHEVAFARDFSDQGPDGLHPNDLGYRTMAQTWFDVIQTMVAGAT